MLHVNSCTYTEGCLSNFSSKGIQKRSQGTLCCYWVPKGQPLLVRCQRNFPKCTHWRCHHISTHLASAHGSYVLCRSKSPRSLCCQRHGLQQLYHGHPYYMSRVRACQVHLQTLPCLSQNYDKSLD